MPPRRGRVSQDQPEPQFLREGETCWRLAQADRVALLPDGASYFAAAKAAMLKAKHSIWLLAWVFDPLTRLTPDRTRRSGDPESADRLGLLLRRLSSLNPALDVRILAWDMPWLIGLPQALPCQRGAAYFVGSRVNYRLDHTLPRSACHHQKALIIDGRVAFVSGGDLGADRWDTPDHEDDAPERRLPTGKRYPARHEMSVMIDGPAVDVLSELFIQRWRAVTGETPQIPDTTEDDTTPWPDIIAPDIRRQPLGVARTLPCWRKHPGAEESLDLHLAAIAQAKDTIYIENQYLTSRLIVEALALRLDEPDGPEVVAIGPANSPSYFDRLTMDSARTLAMNRLHDADTYGRFHPYCARTAGDQPVIVHAKVMIIDDWLLKVGSTNLNNRSTGLDSELDVAIEATDEETRLAIRAFRNREIAHFLGREPEDVVAAIAEYGSIGAAIDALDDGPKRRLRPMCKEEVRGLARFVATRALGDPLRTDDAWRPWVRRRHIRRDIQRLLPQVQLPPEP